MDPGRPERRHQPPRLPRTRGDGPYAPKTSLDLEEAPPHTRGWTLGTDDSWFPAGGSPAHAGMDLLIGRIRGFKLRLPRTRGDGPG